MVHAAPKTTEAAATEAAQASHADARLRLDGWAPGGNGSGVPSGASWRATRGLTGQNLSPRSVRVGGDDRVRTHCVSLLVPSEEAADCNHQHDAGKANRKLHRNVVADGGQ